MFHFSVFEEVDFWGRAGGVALCSWLSIIVAIVLRQHWSQSPADFNQQYNMFYFCGLVCKYIVSSLFHPCRQQCGHSWISWYICEVLCYDIINNIGKWKEDRAQEHLGWCFLTGFTVRDETWQIMSSLMIRKMCVFGWETLINISWSHPSPTLWVFFFLGFTTPYWNKLPIVTMQTHVFFFLIQLSCANSHMSHSRSIFSCS